MSLEPDATIAPVAEKPARHSRWVRLAHWVIAVAIGALGFTGFTILKAHPRLYWGEVGNDLTPALLELPISKNYKHGGWKNSAPFFAEANSPVSAVRTFNIYNQNSWGRSGHFLAAWFLIGTGVAYLSAGFLTRHIDRNLWLRKGDFVTRALWSDFIDHLRLKIRRPSGGPQYGLLQRWSYFGVIFIGLPLISVTGLAMSPAVTANFPFLSGMFGGFQSARTIHFMAFVLLALFVVVHVLMITISGFRRQIRAMTIGE
jgi:thiosulfate reductase cytochrome b subunit